MERLTGGLYRIQVPLAAAPYSWADYKRISEASRHSLRGLKKAAESLGALPDDWRVSFDPVRRQDWIAVEVWRTDRWGCIRRYL